MMRAERILWWIFLLLLVGVSLFVFFHLLALTMVVAAYPEYATFLAGLVGFWLFANRLVFGYGGLANAAATFSRGGELVKEDLAKKARRRIDNLDNFTVISLLALWQESLEPFKYAYYLGFFLVFMGALLFELNLFGGGLSAWAAKAFMLGAAVPTLLVLSLDLLANHYLRFAFTRA